MDNKYIINRTFNKMLLCLLIGNTLAFCYFFLRNYNHVKTDSVKVVRGQYHRLSGRGKNSLRIPIDPGDFELDLDQFGSKFADQLEYEECDTCNFVSVSKSVYVYSAYYDVREGRNIRVVGIAYFPRYGTLECLFQDSSISTHALFYKSGEDHSLPYSACLITCPVPENVSPDNLRQHGIILVGRFGNKTIETEFKVFVPNSEIDKLDFTVCIPPLYGNISLRKIVEFIEVTKILGANHFTFYDYDMHENLTKLLQAYEDMGIVTVKPWKHSFTHDHVWYYGQSATVWDCMLTNMASSKYIAFNDIDEFIVPRKTDCWKDMMESIKDVTSGSIAAYRFQSAAFDNTRVSLTSTPSLRVQEFVTLETIVRDRKPNPMRSKLIVDPQKVFEAGIHHLARGMRRQDRLMNAHEKDAILHHYRIFGDLTVKEEDLTVDLTMWKYFNQITKAVDTRREWLRTKHVFI